MIYTSYYSNPKIVNMFKIGISASVPKGINLDVHLRWLAPSWNLLESYKKSHDEESYTIEYNRLLQESDSKLKLLSRKLYLVGKEKDIVLLCWEGKNRFCHRHLVSSYLRSKFNLNINEL